MRSAIDQVLARTGGVASRGALLRVVTRNQLDDEIRRGRLRAVFPRAYARPWDVDAPEIRDRAALVSVGPPAALSHLSALRRWQLPAPGSGPIHVSVPASRHPLGRSGELAIHRVRQLLPALPLGGLPTVAPANAIAGSWPLLPAGHRRAPAILAVQRRLITPARLRAAMDALPRLAGRAELHRLTDLLESGCESELELWGHLEVFNIPGLDHARRQLRVRVGSKTYRLDLGYEEERVAVELDGRAYHSAPGQWERDIQRDLALATINWQTIRYSHRRLTTDIPGCRRDTLNVLAARRRWRRSG